MALVLGDAHGCPACAHVCTGPMISGSNDVFINGLNAANYTPAFSVETDDSHAEVARRFGNELAYRTQHLSNKRR